MNRLKQGIKPYLLFLDIVPNRRNGICELTREAKPSIFLTLKFVYYKLVF